MWRIQENREMVVALAQEISAGTPDDYRRPPVGDLVYHRLENTGQAFGIEQFTAGTGIALLVAAAHECLHQTVERGVRLLLASLDRLHVAAKTPRDFFGDLLVPERPAEPIG